MKNSRFSFGAYALVFGLSCVLLGAWVVGPDSGEWSASQNRSQNAFPDVSWTQVGDASTYAQLELALSDRIRVKTPAVSSLNTAFLISTSLPLTSPPVSGTFWPTLFPSAGLDTNLYYNREFTNSCHRNLDLMRSGLSVFTGAVESSGKPALILVAPDKSTVMMDSTNPWHSALMACSAAGREDLTQLEREFSFLVQITAEDVYAASPEQPYWSGDTHWKPTAAQSLVDVTQDRFGNVASTPLPDINPWQFNMLQGTLTMLAITQTQSESVALVRNDAVQLVEESTEHGFSYWSFSRPDASPTTPSATLIVDSFVYSTGITAKLASQFSHGYVVPWSSVAGLSDIDATDVILLETVERGAYERIADLNNPHLLDYITRAAPERAN